MGQHRTRRAFIFLANFIILGDGESLHPHPEVRLVPQVTLPFNEHHLRPWSLCFSPTRGRGMVAAAAGGAGRGSEAAFALTDSSPLSWQGEEGQIGPAGLNSSEGPKVSTSIFCCGPWFPTGCPHPRVEGRDAATLRSSTCPSTQGTASQCPPGEGPQPLGPPPRPWHPCTPYGRALTCQHGSGWMSPLSARQDGGAGETRRVA